MLRQSFVRALRSPSARDASTRHRPQLESIRLRSPVTSRYQCLRERSTYSTTEAARALFKKHPLQVSLATIFILFGAGSLIYTNFYYSNYIIGAFTAFPEPVAIKLRRALYYSNISPSPKDAVRYYREALAVAEQEGMDPFSDEILGVKIQLAAFLEKIQQFPKAIQVLELVRGDCLRWIEQNGSKDEAAGKRNRLLQRVVAMSVKLGELYANEYVMEKEMAEERLVWAVETVLKEKKRRQDEGVKPDEGDWLSDDEAGAAMESLAHNYEQKDQHYLAAPLFLQALALSPPSQCHSVILMNNLSISLAQQVPPPSPGTPPPSRPALINAGRSWAQKAIETASAIAPPTRTSECDIGCAVATHNLGEFAEMDGDIAEARRRYEEAASLARAMDFPEGLQNATEGLKRLDGNR